MPSSSGLTTAHAAPIPMLSPVRPASLWAVFRISARITSYNVCYTKLLRCQTLLISIRKIIQAVDIHSRKLNKKFGLTGPQLIVLQEISSHGQISITPLSRATSLSQATVTDITKRLEARGYIARKKREDDRRAVSLFLTEKGQDIIQNLPPRNNFV